MTKKKLAQIRREMKRLEAFPHLDESERYLWARSLVATPQERWEMNFQALRSLGLQSYSEQKRLGFR